MKLSELNRRDFTRLTSAALGGIFAGTMLGCGPAENGGDGDGGDGTDNADDSADDSAADSAGGDDGADEGVNPLLATTDKHVCRGLNTCKGHGKSGDNTCAGTSACATVKHDCAGLNACKGLGGCGAHPGENACKEMGECAVPLMDEKWADTRKRFEKLWSEAKKKPLGEPAAA